MASTPVAFFLGTRVLPLFSVVIESATGLAAQLTGSHHLAHKQGGAVLGVMGLVVEGVHDGQAHIQADQITQCQRTHWVVGAQFHGDVHALYAGHTSVNQIAGLVDHRYQDLVHYEAGGLIDLYRLLANGLDQPR